MSRFHTVVAAIDFSDSSADVLDAALALAPPEDGGQIHLIHVVPDPVPAIWTDDLPQLEVAAMARTWTEVAERQLAAIVAGRRLDAARVTTAVVVVGQPATEIVRQAEQRHADAIVVGSHGHSAVRRFLLGSVADKVIRQAHCAVLVVPHRTLRETAPTVATEARSGATIL
jgi:nucleotide-binding universal stress UspA family protein